jgi:hypothetical protein
MILTQICNHNKLILVIKFHLRVVEIIIIINKLFKLNSTTNKICLQTNKKQKNQKKKKKKKKNKCKIKN